MVNGKEELEVAISLAAENPIPVLNINLNGQLLYTNSAALVLTKVWGIKVGSTVPLELVEHALAEKVVDLELPVGARTFSFHVVRIADVDRANIFATDVTAKNSITKFPEENPNPVLRTTVDGEMIYANPAAQDILKSWEIELGSVVPHKLMAHAGAAPEKQLEIECGFRTYPFHVVPVPELDFVNIYGTDVTAIKVMTEFPNQNPNPVLRIDMEGKLLYCNSAAEYILTAWEINLGDRVPTMLIQSSTSVPVNSLEMEVGTLTYLFNTARVSAFDFINVYATDITAAKDSEQILAKLAKYFSPQVYETIFSGDLEVRIQTSRKRLTVFFSDIKGFSQLTERLEPEDVTELITEYLTVMTNIAYKYGGTVDKYIGDAIMVFFGDPHSTGIREDAIACIRMAMEMKNTIYKLQNTWKAKGISHPLAIRIGIHTDICTVGNFGSSDRLDYTTIGKGVNWASRLESNARPNQILISEDTHLLVRNEIECNKAERITVKNITHPVQTYEVRDDRNTDVSELDLNESEDGFTLILDPMTVKDIGQKRELLERAISLLNRIE